MIRQTIGKVSVFGWLDNVPIWRDLPYPIKGALLRALKVGLSGAIAVLVTAASAGTLFPAAWGPQVAIILTAIINAADKYIREWNIEDEENDLPEEEPEEEELPVVNTDGTIPGELGEPDNTDATVVETEDGVIPVGEFEPTPSVDENDLPNG